MTERKPYKGAQAPDRGPERRAGAGMGEPFRGMAAARDGEGRPDSSRARRIFSGRFTAGADPAIGTSGRAGQ